MEMLGQARGNVQGFSKPLTGITSANSPLAKASHKHAQSQHFTHRERERIGLAVQSVYHRVYI